MPRPERELGAARRAKLATVLWVLPHGLAQLQITGHLHEHRTIDRDTGSTNCSRSHARPSGQRSETAEPSAPATCDKPD